MSTEPFITNHMLAVGNTSTRGRSHRACCDILRSHCQGELIEIGVGGSYVFFSGQVDGEKLDAMATELHDALRQLSAEPVMLVCAGKVIFCASEEESAISFSEGDLPTNAIEEPVAPPPPTTKSAGTLPLPKLKIQ